MRKPESSDYELEVPTKTKTLASALISTTLTDIGSGTVAVRLGDRLAGLGPCEFESESGAESPNIRS